jgi:hypothetical protein
MAIYFDDDQRSLDWKLRLLALGEEMGLTAAEAAIYGVADADTYPDDEYMDLEDERPAQSTSREEELE